MSAPFGRPGTFREFSAHSEERRTKEVGETSKKNVVGVFRTAFEPERSESFLAVGKIKAPLQYGRARLFTKTGFNPQILFLHASRCLLLTRKQCLPRGAPDGA